MPTVSPSFSASWETSPWTTDRVYGPAFFRYNGGMKVLLTSGGTKVPIDRVRYLMNSSHGTFGSKIAWELLGATEDVELLFFTAEWALTPFTVNVNLDDRTEEYAHALVSKLASRRRAVGRRYVERTYKDFDRYESGLEILVRDFRPDVVVLAAAVSDYLCASYVDGKIRSSEDLNVALTHAPKLIGKVKEWRPEAKLVGFKLMVDSDDDQLIAAAQKSILDNRCEFVVANDLRDIRQGRHRLLIADPGGVQEHETDPDDPNHLARVVAHKILGI